MDDVRLIDANALKEKMTVGALGGHRRIWVCGVIDDSPTVDAVPVKRGKWIECETGCIINGEPEKSDMMKCSNCYEVGVRKSAAPFCNFCPFCGADMRGKANDR